MCLLLLRPILAEGDTYTALLEVEIRHASSGKSHLGLYHQVQYHYNYVHRVVISLALIFDYMKIIPTRN